MKNKLIALSALAAVLVSCESGSVSGENDILGNGCEMLFATTEDLTKTALSGNDVDGYQVVWSSGDEITVGGYSGNVYLLHSGAGTTSGVFYKTSGQKLADGEYDAYYRMYSNSLPANQKYSEGQIKNAPMHATVTVSNGEPQGACFRNLGGLLRLTIKNSEYVKLKSITVSADQPLSGAFDIVDNAAVMHENAAKYVTLNAGDAEYVELTSKGRDFYIALPAGSYSGVVIAMTDVNGSVCTKTLKSGVTLAIERSKITKASFSVQNSDFVSSSLVAVDLGLPSGTRWANINIGASSPSAYGDYFAWGETTAKKNYSMSTYFDTSDGGTTFSKYKTSGGYTTLQPEDDVAHVKWGGDWRMPTLAEFQELANEKYTTWTWVGSSPVTDSNGDKCYYGFLITSKTNSNSIFLKADGSYQGTAFSGYLDHGYYWSSTLGNDNTAHYLYLLYYISNGHYTGEYQTYHSSDRSYGMSVRPVCSTTQPAK